MEREEHERIRDPQQELEPEHQRRVDVLAEQERDEDATAADVDVTVSEQAAAHYEVVIRILEALFRGDAVDFEHRTDISVDERAALEAFREVITGKDRSERIVYAEERLLMMNDALAVLQPTLALGLAPELEAFRPVYDLLAEQLEELRQHLESLDAAQEEPEQELAEDEDTEDEDDDGEGDGDGEDGGDDAEASGADDGVPDDGDAPAGDEPAPGS